MSESSSTASAKRSGFPWSTLIFIAILVAGGFYGWRWFSSRKTASSTIEYRTVTISKGDVTQQVTANGSLNPVRSIEVGSQISGTLLDVRVDFNSKVKAGELIAQIDPATYERALVQAQAELANAAAGLELAQVNFARSKDLLAANLISKSEFDQAKATHSQAEAVVKTRQANVERAKVDLDRTSIFAPIDGMVISRRVEIGQTVAASLNSPTLFVIAKDLAKMQIEAAVSEADVGIVTEGLPVNFTVDAFPGRKFDGVVRQVRFAPTTNQNVVTYTTLVDVDNRELKLRPGMTANANFITAQKKGVLRIPSAALRFRPPTNAVVRAEAKPATAPSGAAKEEKKVELATSGPFAGLPIPPWQAGGERRRPTEAERADYEASLTSEQREKYQQVMAEMRARFAQMSQGGGGGGEGGGRGPGGGGGGGDRPRRSEPEGPRTQTVYLVDKSDPATSPSVTVLKQITIKVGISDGSNTEVIEGLKDGDVVAQGTVSQASASATPTTPNPFGGPFGGGRR